MVPYLYELLAVSEVRCEPAECSTSGPNASHVVQEYGVGDSVKCCAEVEEDDNGKKSAGVSCMEEVISDFDQGGFSAVFWTETGLERFMEVVCVKVGL